MNFNSLKNLSIKQLIAVNLTVAILACGAIYLTIVWTVKDIKNLNLSIITQKIDLGKQVDKASNMSILGEKLKQITPQLEKFDNIFINKNRELEFITSLEELASKNKVEQKINLGTLSEEKGDPYGKTSLSLDVQGDFLNIMNYLTEIEALNYHFNIDTLDFSYKQITDTRRPSIDDEGAPQRISNQGGVSLKISGEVYWK